ncbi:putative serine/threonine-protein kinase [Phtheirospermum japonicum]|uniref:Putative serine/threonine-protein kinase n=1 Tax=Phtheirospermum japonicum TaxID=374723 RepID=A0A830B677_9LAMI|nr:putative serine/threonine-protein kinase [Phtheirospermum japonicum]
MKIAAISLFHCFQPSTTSLVAEEENEEGGKAIQNLGFRVFAYTELKTATQGFKNKIGEGVSGSVYKLDFDWIDLQNKHSGALGVGTPSNQNVHASISPRIKHKGARQDGQPSSHEASTPINRQQMSLQSTTPKRVKERDSQLKKLIDKVVNANPRDMMAKQIKTQSDVHDEFDASKKQQPNENEKPPTKELQVSLNGLIPINQLQKFIVEIVKDKFDETNSNQSTSKVHCGDCQRQV